MRVIPALCAFLLGALPSVALAAEGHSAGFINFDKGLIIQAVNFLLLMFVLTKLLYKPLVAKMEERTQAIKKSLDEAQAANNIRAMVRLARAQGAEVVLIGVPKPGLLPSPAAFYADIAKELRLPYEETALKKILTDNALKSDLVHPNAAGYARLAQAVAALLKKTGAV